MSDSVCCLDLLQETDKPSRSPFTKFISLNWWDGPIGGLIKCGTCTRSYRFELLAQDGGDYEYSSWDEGRDLTIFGLAELDGAHVETIMNVLSEHESPTWPKWYRGPYRDHSRYERNSRGDGIANTILAQAGKPSLAIAVHMGDLLVEVLQSRRIGSDNLIDIPSQQWLEFFGYSKQNHTEDNT